VRPYGAYTFLDPKQISPPTTGDALARQWVRLEEIDQSFALIVEVLAQIKELPHGPWRVEIPVVDGLGLSWVEAPQGELLYLIEIESGRLVRVKPRCPSFHNLSLLPAAFNGDIFTDFVFIEASFGFSVAGVSG
jgi:Ni,Fe-hydrogenase III large subunit